MTFAEKVIEFNRNIQFDIPLPENIQVMNPFRENPNTLKITEVFYRKFYSDHNNRYFIIGINPGRFGGGATGIPFTDTKRLEEKCGIKPGIPATYEPSSVFIYSLIEKYGGVNNFYRDFYINSICPLGFIALNAKGNWTNYNYYDNRELLNSVKPFLIRSLNTQLEFGINRSVAFVLGKKNYEIISKINEEHNKFHRLVMLEHPRYIVQYKFKIMGKYIDDYIDKLMIIERDNPHIG